MDSGGSRGTSNNCVREQKLQLSFGERLNLRQFLLSYTGVRLTLNPPMEAMM